MDRRLKEDLLIEDALKSQSLAPMPRSITPEVMARIQAADGRRPALLTWSDLALSFVIACCIAALWFALVNLPPILVVKLQIQGILLYQDFLVNARWLVPALLFGTAVMLVTITIPSIYRMTVDRRQ